MSIVGDNTGQTTDGIWRPHPDRQPASPVCDNFRVASTGNCLHCGNNADKHYLRAWADEMGTPAAKAMAEDLTHDNKPLPHGDLRIILAADIA